MSLDFCQLKAIKILRPFASLWFCELGFPALTEIKFKKRERLLKVYYEIRLSILEPCYDLICSRKRAQFSY